VDHCEECGFVYASVRLDELPGRLRDFGPRYRATVGARDDVRRRPAPEVWSPLEYACHVRDVLRVQRERLASALDTHEPEFPPMRRDERAVEERYNEQGLDTVLADLAAAADALADAVAALRPEDWLRTGVYPWPTRQVRTLEWVVRHSVHEGEHHLLDIAKQAL
jgi:S-DNA-T family DNA segregation ATPase FtsK/SpoIIIE